MEINANPSMNMFLEKEGLDGEKEKVLSELDKHLKTTVLQDAFQIIKGKGSKGFGSFEQILPVEDPNINKFYIWDGVREIFDRLGGVKKPDHITASQFEKLGRCSLLTSSQFGKADYAIVFKEFIRGSESNYMAFEEFFKAIEVVTSKIYPSGDAYENLLSYITNALASIK